MNSVQNELRLQLQKVDDQTIKIGWYDTNNGDLSYRVALPHLAQTAASVRDKLKAMIQQYIRAPQSELTRNAMGQLLISGNELFEALFLATSDFAIAATAKQTYIEFDKVGRLGLAIKVDPALTYPFALAVPFEDGFDNIVTNLTKPHNAFWGLRHNLSISTFGAGISHHKIVDHPECRPIAGVSKDLFNLASASVTDNDEKRFLNELCGLWGDDLTFTFRDFLTVSKRVGADPAAKLRIAYLYGHASGDRFQLAKDDEITAATLATRLGDSTNRAERQHTLLFLNGCDTAAEGEHFAFTDLLRYPNISGLIGTEVRVPDRFAFRFALAFFCLVIFKGRTFREAISELRRTHLPISLVYALYATDGLTLVPSSDAKVQTSASAFAVNFSEEDVKCSL